MLALTFQIDGLEGIGAPDVGMRHGLDQATHLLPEIRTLAVKLAEQRMNGVEIGAQTRVKALQRPIADLVLKIGQDRVEK